MEIKVGDIVQLKSGSPLMTLGDIGEEGKVRCVWFEGSDYQVAWFNLASLVKVGG